MVLNVKGKDNKKISQSGKNELKVSFKLLPIYSVQFTNSTEDKLTFNP